jgi:hypothetical protein
VHVAVQALALRLERLEHALRDLEGLVAVLRRLRRDPRAEQVRRARLDVLDDKLQLLEPAIRDLRRLIRFSIDGATRLRLGGALVRPRELVDLLPRTSDVVPKGVDDRVELGFEVVPVLDQPRSRARARSIGTCLVMGPR